VPPQTYAAIIGEKDTTEHAATQAIEPAAARSVTLGLLDAFVTNRARIHRSVVDGYDGLGQLNRFTAESQERCARCSRGRGHRQERRQRTWFFQADSGGRQGRGFVASALSVAAHAAAHPAPAASATYPATASATSYATATATSTTRRSDNALGSLGYLRGWHTSDVILARRGGDCDRALRDRPYLRVRGCHGGRALRDCSIITIALGERRRGLNAGGATRSYCFSSRAPRHRGTRTGAYLCRAGNEDDRVVLSSRWLNELARGERGDRRARGQLRCPANCSAAGCRP
jgi:hypothetical protein